MRHGGDPCMHQYPWTKMVKLHPSNLFSLFLFITLTELACLSHTIQNTRPNRSLAHFTLHTSPCNTSTLQQDHTYHTNRTHSSDTNKPASLFFLTSLTLRSSLDVVHLFPSQEPPFSSPLARFSSLLLLSFTRLSCPPSSSLSSSSPSPISTSIPTLCLSLLAREKEGTKGYTKK